MAASSCPACAQPRQKKTASHVVTELESTGDCSQAGKPFFCPSHPAEELRLFCEQCDQPVCRVCVVEGHRQHPYDFTSNVVHRHGDSLRELLRSTQQRMRTLEDVLGQIDDVGSAIRVRAEAVATEICLFARGYVKAIEEHRDRLLKQLEDLKVQKENLLHLRKAQLQQLLMDMRTGVEFTERLLTSGSDLEILVTKGVVASRLAKLNSAAYTTHPSVDDSIQFSPQERAGQCHGYEVFGAVVCKAVDPAKCTLHGEGLRSAHQNELTGFTLLCNDTSGERMGRGGEAVTVTITHKDKKNCAVKSTVCDNGDGTYHVSYSPEEPGLYAVCVYVKGQHVQGSPFAVTVKSKFRKHQGVFHCCTFCSSGGQKAARCACGGTMPGRVKPGTSGTDKAASHSSSQPSGMTTVIIILAAVIALIIGFGISGKHSISVTTLTSPGNIGQSGLLGCTFEPDIWMGSIVIRWAKAGVAGLVHEFRGGKDFLQEQDAVFQGRTAVFADQVIGGNASLELREVQLSDAGTYRCSVTTSRGSGVAVLRYQTGAFSTPKVQVQTGSSGDTLHCEAPRWFPRPTVHWTAFSDSGKCLPHSANTSYELNSENITLKVVSFLHDVTANATYTCVIENGIAKATGNIKVTASSHYSSATDFNITKETSLHMVNLNTESVSSSLPVCHWMLLLPMCLLST
ncbi:hypothetical protein ASZ78_005359 [Callipepla squamata]|uniref:RING-type E3 ubiquitin transferase n=1 Tax=Callipepla squamata TaxID=9009 RepID=A0A226NNE1_CALSU|nr:hypothetical protein ASZ78_005359 [Callipepla squamata]